MSTSVLPEKSEHVEASIVRVLTVLFLLLPSVVGAILTTAYVSGMSLDNLRMNGSVVGSVVVGVLAWGGLFLRDERVRALIFLQKQERANG